jgi:hypothetical protein
MKLEYRNNNLFVADEQEPAGVLHLTAKVYDAPKDAVNFDKMIVIFSNPLCKTIKMVTFYDTKTQKVTGSY